MATLLRVAGIVTGVAFARRAADRKDSSIETFLRSATEGDTDALDKEGITAPLVPWRQIGSRDRGGILLFLVGSVSWTGNVALGLVLALGAFLLLTGVRACCGRKLPVRPSTGTRLSPKSEAVESLHAE
jgi:hypothetical protein